MKSKYCYLIIYISLIILILMASLQNSDQSSNQSSIITDIVIDSIEFIKNDEISWSYEEVHHIIRKTIGHFGSFLLCGFFGLLTFYNFLHRKKKSLILTMIVGAVVAFSSEMLQLISEGRSCEFKDMVIDTFGYLWGTIICLLIIIIVNKRKLKKTFCE